MNGIEKVLLIGGGGYLLYQTGILSALTGGLIPAPAAAGSPPSTSSGSTGTPSSGPTNTTAPPPTNPAAPPPATPTWQLVLAKATAQNPPANPLTLTWDQWNYYLSQVSGLTGSSLPQASAVPAIVQNPNQLLQVSQWWAYAQQASPGLSGLGIVGYRPRRSGFGSAGMWGGGKGATLFMPRYSPGPGFGGLISPDPSMCDPMDPVASMQPPVDSNIPTTGVCNSG